MAQQIKKALIVDDSRLARIALSRLLKNREIDVDMVGSGHEGWVYLQSNQPDIVFMDCMMPGMDGFETASRIFSDPACHQPAIIMYTSQDTDADRQRAREIGIAGFLGKPTTLAALDELLESVAAGRRLPEAPVAAPAPVPASPTPELLPEQESAASRLDADELSRIAQAAAQKAAQRYFEELRQELGDTLADALQQIPSLAERRAAAVVEAAVERLTPAPAPAPEPLDTDALEMRVRDAAEESAQAVAGGIARDAGAAAARALAPQLIDEARQAAIEAVELADLHGRLQSIIEQDVVPALRDELTATAQQATAAAVEAGLEARVEMLESRLLTAAEHAAAAELRASSGALLLKAGAVGVVAGIVAAVVTGLLF
jgi:CheY-like chemotaxis protein